jgi:putative membrane protein
MKAKIIIIIILAGLAAIFIFQNAAMVELKFLFWTLPVSMTLTMFLIFSSGIITGWLLRGTFSRRKSRTQNKQGVLSGERIN